MNSIMGVTTLTEACPPNFNLLIRQKRKGEVMQPKQLVAIGSDSGDFIPFEYFALELKTKL